MSAHYKILQHDHHKGIRVDCRGNLSSTDLFNAIAEVFSQVAPSELDFQIIDLSDIDSLDIPAEHLLQLAKEDRLRLQSNPKMKLAFVTDHDVVSSVVLMWRGYIDLSDYNIQQFETLQQAYEWVGYEWSLEPV